MKLTAEQTYLIIEALDCLTETQCDYFTKTFVEKAMNVRDVVAKMNDEWSNLNPEWGEPVGL